MPDISVGLVSARCRRTGLYNRSVLMGGENPSRWSPAQYVFRPGKGELVIGL